MKTIEKRNKGLLFIVSVIAVLYLFYNNDFGIISNVNNLKVPEEQYHELIAERTASELENTFQLKVNDYLLPFDEETETFLYTVNQIENIEEFNPLFEIVMDKNLDYDIALLEQELTDEMIKNNEPLKILVYSDEKYEEFEVRLTTLPIVTLSVDQPEETPSRPIGNAYQRASMTLYNNIEKAESDLYIRIRGGTSRAFPKNQYRINLREFTIGGDEKVNHLSLLGMREDDDWILYSPYNDPEKSRNVFSSNLWHDTMATENRFAINTGTEGEYVELFINNRYWGLYALMHPIDGKQVDLDLKNNVEESELYYRTVTNKALDPIEFENSTGDELVLGRFELRELDKPFGDPKQWDPIYEHMEMRMSDVETLENYLFERTDLENQINYYLFTLLLQATDNNFKNHNYISKFDGDTRVMVESPWDLDLTWGLRWHPESPVLAIVKGEPVHNHIAYVTLIHSAIKRGSEDITQRVKDKYQKLRANEWSEAALMTMLDAYEKDVYHSGSISRDKERWPDTAYNESMDGLRTYILERLKEMDDFIAYGI